MGAGLSPEEVARGFRRVRYNTHRAFFALLGMHEVAAAFDRVWRICEARTDPTHPALVLGHDAAHWAREMADPALVGRLLPALADVLDAEAVADEGRGRALLGRRLREAARLVRGYGGRMTMEDPSVSEKSGLPPGFQRPLFELARIGYEAYGDEAGWRAYNGEPMPRWDDLPEHIHRKWTAAVLAVAKALAG